MNPIWIASARDHHFAYRFPYYIVCSNNLLRTTCSDIVTWAELAEERNSFAIALEEILEGMLEMRRRLTCLDISAGWSLKDE
jgi:hypothetical protein